MNVQSAFAFCSESKRGYQSISGWLRRSVSRATSCASSGCAFGEGVGLVGGGGVVDVSGEGVGVGVGDDATGVGAGAGVGAACVVGARFVVNVDLDVIIAPWLGDPELAAAVPKGRSAFEAALGHLGS